MKRQNFRVSIATPNKSRQGGFTLLELAIATLILMVGIAGVVQLVPASQVTNYQNRVDTTAMVFAQRELDQMIYQPLTNATFNDADARLINLGSQTVSNTVFGGPVMLRGTVASLDFGVAAAPGYSYTFTDSNDLNDPAAPRYEMRWAVISTVNGGVVVSKRFIVGCRRAGGTGNGTPLLLPAVVDTLVQK